MSTRSRIAIKRKDGSYDSIYCHSDGYPEYTGKMLNDYYNNSDMAEDLIKLGDLSYIDEKLNPTGAHSFNNPEPGVTVAYGRDRGETGVDAVHSKNDAEFADLCNDSWAEYVYIWDGEKWNTVTPEDINKVEESAKVNESITRSILNKLNEDDDWKAKLEAKRKVQTDFANSVDPEPLYNKIREMVGDKSIQFKSEVREGREGAYIKVSSDNIVDKCGIFQLAIKECYIGTFSTGIVVKDEEKGGNPYWWGSIDLSYSSHSGGSNGMEILRFNYNRNNDGKWEFAESRD